MKYCPTCGDTFGDEVKFCPKDGSALTQRGQTGDPMIGKRLLGKWEVLSKIGAGGFGTVYKVRDVRLNHVEALKVFDRRRLHPDEAEEALARFQREAMLLKPLGIKSQNIVGLSAFEEDPEEGLLYFTMEYVDGENLSQVLIKEGPLQWERALGIMDQVLGALIVAHEDEIVHRDMKLENVMLTKDKRGLDVAKVLDFGIAKPLGQQSLTNLALGGPGTPGYAAPEQLEAGEIDQRTDLFALGVVYYGVLTGREPWLGGVITEPTSKGLVIMTQTLKGEPIPLRKWNEDIPQWVEDFVFRLMEKKPEDRFQSAFDLRQYIKEMTTPDAAPVAVTPDFASLAVTTLDPSSGDAVEGVAIRVRKGKKVVAEGRTPWSADSLEPGRYEIDLRDPSYEMDSREVELVKGSVADVKLNSVILVRDLGALEVEAYGDEEGVEVRVKQGRKVVAEGLTPWANDELEIGEYEVQVVDKRFKRTSRHIRIVKGETTSAKLGIKPANFWDSWGRQIIAAGGTVAAALLIWILLPEATTELGQAITYEEYEQHLDANEILEASVFDGAIVGNVQTASGDRFAFNVPMVGLGLQSTMRDLETRDLLPRRLLGQGSVLLDPVDGETSEPIPEAGVSLASAEGEVCGGASACPGEVALDVGWYTLSQASITYRVAGLTFSDPGGVYADESVGPEEAQGARFFVPANDSVRVVLTLAPSALGLQLNNANTALEEGRFRAALTAIRQVRNQDLGDASQADVEALNAGAADLAARVGQSAIGQRDVDATRQAIDLAEEIQPGNSLAATLRPRVADALADSARALYGAGDSSWDMVVAVCEGYLPGHESCAAVTQQALEDAQRPPPDDPTGDPTQQPEVVTPPVREPTNDERADEQLADAQAAFGRGDLAGARSAAQNCLVFRARDPNCSRIVTDVEAQEEAAEAQANIDRAVNNAESRLAANDLTAARAAVTNCLTLDANNANCLSIRQDIDAAARRATRIDSLSRAAQNRMTANDHAQALTLANECLGLDSGNATCRGIVTQANQAEEAQRTQARADSVQREANAAEGAAEDAQSRGAVDEAERNARECLRIDGTRSACTAVLTWVDDMRSGPSVNGFSVASAGMEGGNIGRTAAVSTSFTVGGPAGATWCAAAFFTPSDGRNLVAKAAEYTVGSRVVAMTQFTQQDGALVLTLPADELRIENTGDHRFDVFVGVWNRACPPPENASGAMAEATVEMCIARDFSGDWYPECGEEREQP